MIQSILFLSIIVILSVIAREVVSRLFDFYERKKSREHELKMKTITKNEEIMQRVTFLEEKLNLQGRAVESLNTKLSFKNSRM